MRTSTYADAVRGTAPFSVATRPSSLEERQLASFGNLDHIQKPGTIWL